MPWMSDPSDPYGSGYWVDDPPVTPTSVFDDEDTAPVANYETREPFVGENGVNFNYGSPGSPTEAINRNNPTGDPRRAYVDTGDTGGSLDGVTTVAPGRSITPEQAQAHIAQALAQGVPQSFVQDFLVRNPHDTNRILEAYYSSGGDSSAIPTYGAFGTGAPNSIQPFTKTYTRPTADEIKNSPTFQFRLGEAMQAIQRAGLAKGVAGTNQVWKALEEQASGIASDEYALEDDRRWREYTGEADIHFANEDRRYDSQRTNRMDDFNIFDTNRNFDFGVSDSNRNFDRLMTNDAWSRGTDVFNMDRLSRLDQEAADQWLAEYLLKKQPRPY